MDIVLAAGQALLAARADEDDAVRAIFLSDTSEKRFMLKAARLRTSELSAEFDKAVRKAFEEDVLVAGQEIKP